MLFSLQVVNFMSTDTDRIVNFGISFHMFWSLPFQIIVALVLLYLQVSSSNFVHVAFTKHSYNNVTIANNSVTNLITLVFLYVSMQRDIACSSCLLFSLSQVNLASLTGLAFCILLIPVNRWLAVKIGKLSTRMMAQKDNRVKVSWLFSRRILTAKE